ncbi:peptidoglycan-binding domain-containing protein [uncultured Lamprocystis sp.]|uniref:peptidoglycan-binding domain-containing protein n=1 Tax=uncultured Lamprocystis sp. TaxID=543132 RepID=UPI0025D88B0C|nr:peptidoglycan-binding domain-containing protein [uncultured Lamprocystis sp.]
MTTQARSIKFPVGKMGLNDPPDVRVIQKLLNMALDRKAKFKASGLSKLVPDGDCGKLTIGAIEQFQEKVMGWSGPAVDGTVAPNKDTWKALNGNVASVSAVKPRVDPRPTAIGGFKAFKQGDYSSEVLGDGSNNIGSHGCALCTLTMAATVIGTPTTHWPEGLEPCDLDPPAVNRILRRAGAFESSDLKMPAAAEALGMNYDEHGRVKLLSPNDVEYISSNLLAGHPIAAQVDYKSSAVGDHWILLIRRNGTDEFDAIDPATGRALKLTSAPQTPASGPSLTRTVSIPHGVLFGWGQGGSTNQQQYVVVRFALLAPAWKKRGQSPFLCYA